MNPPETISINVTHLAQEDFLEFLKKNHLELSFTEYSDWIERKVVWKVTIANVTKRFLIFRVSCVSRGLYMESAVCNLAKSLSRRRLILPNGKTIKCPVFSEPEFRDIRQELGI